MSAFGGAPGYESYSSAQQRDRGGANSFQDGLAPEPSAPPVHLSRMLYIPSHSSSTTHIPVHDISANYKFAIGHAPMGGSAIIGDALMGSKLYMVRLGTMRKPSADSGDTTKYGISFEVEESQVSALVRRFPQGQERAVETKISIPKSTQNFQMIAKEPIDVAASFPLTEQHPFFTFNLPSLGKTLQWQINPSKDGPLRYMLVELKTEDVSKDSKERQIHGIKAIYHHIGQGSSLTLQSSEGVLLVSESDDSDLASLTMEMEILSSLVGLLWRVRGLKVKPTVSDVLQLEKPSFLQRLLGKN